MNILYLYVQNKQNILTKKVDLVLSNNIVKSLIGDHCIFISFSYA